MLRNDKETCLKSNNSKLGPIIQKSEFLMSSEIVPCIYRNSGILRLSNRVFEFFELAMIIQRIVLKIIWKQT